MYRQYSGRVVKNEEDNENTFFILGGDKFTVNNVLYW